MKILSNIYSSGIYRKTDMLGRITIPKEMRDSMGIVDKKSYLEIIKISNDEILLKKTNLKANIYLDDENIGYYKCICGNKIGLDKKNKYIYCPRCGNKFIWD